MSRGGRLAGIVVALVLMALAALWVSRWAVGPAPEGTVAGPSAGDKGEVATQTLAAAECVLTVIPTSVVLRRTPGGLQAGYARAESGEYAAQGDTTVTTGGDTQHWYKITAEGKTGWVKDNTLTLIESDGCPP